MGIEAEIDRTVHKSPWRVAGWTTATLVLLAPLIAMQVSREVNWKVGDFIFAGLLIGLVGIVFELTVRVSRSPSFRGGVAAALAASFLIIWANGAVGMIGNEDNPYNLLFIGVIGLALIGTIAARFRPSGMVVVMLVAAVAHGGIAFGGMNTDLRGGVFSLLSASLWLLSAGLFRISGRS